MGDETMVMDQDVGYHAKRDEMGREYRVVYKGRITGVERGLESVKLH
jgi:hypothetical protein